MILSAFLLRSIERLKKASVDNPQLDARLLFCHGLRIDRAQLVSQSERILTNEEQIVLDILIERREARQSVARIIGKREFWGLEFALNEATLEPRPDSEILIEAVLRADMSKSSILDLGTGTGCLLLSLLNELPNAKGLGLDINPRAIEQAAQNAKQLGLENRARFEQSDWLQNAKGTFDVIISNPPYIPAIDIPSLEPEVRSFDPMLALNGGNEGLDPYRLLIPQLSNFLNPRGFVAFEIGIDQDEAVSNLLEANNFKSIAVHMDLGGIPRVVTAAK